MEVLVKRVTALEKHRRKETLHLPLSLSLSLNRSQWGEMRRSLSQKNNSTQFSLRV